MQQHDFMLVIPGLQLSEPDVDTEEAEEVLANALFEAGCDDCLPGQQGGKIVIGFTRVAPSMEDAIATAKADVLKAFASLIQVERE